ncbi:MAG: IS110 family transposase [Dehalococcoidia bacterium]|nr:IS110 family transposase [Dehalococcoidia bacterium]
MTQTTLQEQHTGNEQVLYMAFELANKTWKLAFGSGGNPRIIEMPARDQERLIEEIARAKKRFSLPQEAHVVSCYEAGRDGFWIHRYLLSVGIQNIVVDSSSIEVNRRKRRAKTDRIDAMKLYTMLVRHDRGEKGVWSVVRVPSREDEDERRTHREIERLQKERGAHSSRIKSLLVTQGIVAKVNRDLPELLENVRLWDGSPLSPQLKAEIKREFSRMEEVDRQLREIRGQQRDMLKVAEATKEEEASPSANSLKKVEMVLGLTCLRGIGERSAWPLIYEFLWRDFGNRREVASAAGLVGTPYDSGGSVREQGISKAGNKRIRRLMVELGWYWLRYQPESAITVWFNERFAQGGKRMRRIGIIGVARKLLIALWKYVKFGQVPEGAQLKEGKCLT